MRSEDAKMVVVVRSGPDSAGARRALAMGLARTARGEPTTLALLGDAVRVANDAGTAGTTVLCLGEDAEMRGLELEGLPHVRAVGYDELVDALMSGERVIGAL